ncbi:MULTISPECIES: hypothetical protein [unclassified Pseudoclavibacter]|uniref:hypothetical protein n=1 Tax=unclassified Pseudoclavibacter TaxID=2615177 RepID=UPI001BA57926|nr:hypothetical protein [Pseudoclavibacter sp. Marseille-Q4354]MBS3177825.1 hypothetical protein [Pseudoclavibacter sp. Marseille-Q4354]
MTQHDTEPQDPSGSSTRRQVLQTAAWTVPVLATAVAAPLAAASPGGCGTLNWSAAPVTVNNTRVATVSTGGSSASITIVRSTIAGTPLTGSFTPLGAPPNPSIAPSGSLYMVQQTAAANAPARQRLTFTSTVPIRSVRFIVHDHTRGITYSDGVSIEGFATRDATFLDTRPAGITRTGTGSNASPWGLSGVDTVNATGRTQITASSPTANVSSFTFDYSNLTTPVVAGGSSMQYIALSNIEICF